MINKNEIPSNWTIAKFEDLLDYIQPTEYIVASTEYDDKYNTPVLTAGKSFIKGYTNETNGIFESVPVIIFDDFTTATKFVNFPFKVKSSAMKILKPTSDFVNIKLAYYFMQTVHLKSETHKRYWISEYSKLTIPLPPHKEQQRIFDKIEVLITDLDKGIEYLETAQQQLKVYRQVVLNSITSDKNLMPIHSIIEKLDQGWSPRCLNENSINHEEWAVIKTSAIQHGKFIEAENKILPKSLHPRMQHELKREDILITRAGPRVRAGVCCLVRTVRPKLLNCDKVYRIRLQKEKVLPEYFELILNSPKYLRVIEKMKSGISDSGVNLTQTAFVKIEVPVPSPKEQKKIIQEIENRLSICDKMEETLEHSLQQAEALRFSIIKKGFEGKLVAQNLNDEPAQRLLERIRTEIKKNNPDKSEKKVKIKTSKKKVQKV